MSMMADMGMFGQTDKKRQIADLRVEIEYLGFKIAVLDHYLYSLDQDPSTDLRLGQIYFNLLSVKQPRIATVIRGTIYDPFNSLAISVDTEKRVLGLWKRLPEYVDQWVV